MPPENPARTMAPVLRDLGDDDLDDVVGLHLSAFPSSAISALGVEAVKRQYRWYLRGPHDAVCTGAWLGDRLAGFCFSGLFKGATGGFIRKNRAYLIQRLMLRPWHLWNPQFRDRVRVAIRVLNPLRRKQKPEPAKPWWNQYGILAIAVDPELHGAGVGRALMENAESAAAARSVPEMVLTVSPDNTRAIRFYEMQGWVRVGSGEEWAGEMRKSLISMEP